MIYCYSYTHTHLKGVLSINRFVVDVRPWMIHIHECEFTFCVCHTDIHLPAPPNCSTIRVYLSRIQTHVVTTDDTQRFSSIGGVAKAYCVHRHLLWLGLHYEGATITRFQPELPLQNCQLTRFTHKEPGAWIFMWEFPYISTLAPTFLNLYRPNNTCLKSLWQSVFSSGFTITLKIQDKKSSY